MNNNMIIAGLVVVVLVLAGVIYQQNYKPKTPGQEIADGVGRAVEHVGNTIQDASHK